MICAIIVIPYYTDVICDAKNVWHVIEYFIHFVLEHIACWSCSKWELLIPVSAKLEGECCQTYDFLSNFRLWHPELASMIDMYLTLLSLGSMSFNVGPLCMGLIGTWFNHAGSKHNLTLPLALGTNTIYAPL